MVSTSQLQIGQKVRLNSGSPELTITEIGERIGVEWTNGSKTESSTFPSVCLTAL